MGRKVNLPAFKFFSGNFNLVLDMVVVSVYTDNTNKEHSQ